MDECVAVAVAEAVAVAVTEAVAEADQSIHDQSIHEPTGGFSKAFTSQAARPPGAKDLEKRHLEKTLKSNNLFPQKTKPLLP